MDSKSILEEIIRLYETRESIECRIVALKAEYNAMEAANKEKGVAEDG